VSVTFEKDVWSLQAYCNNCGATSMSRAWPELDSTRDNSPGDLGKARP
jgi:hypothetical protein